MNGVAWTRGADATDAAPLMSEPILGGRLKRRAAVIMVA
jgi:hypothetical protein